MPKYDSDPPIFFDDGWRYDMDEAPARRQKEMNSIRRNWSTYSVANRIAFFGNVLEQCTNNPAVPTPNAPFTALSASQPAAKAAHEKVLDLEAQLKAARRDCAAKVDAMCGDGAVLASHVEGATAADAALMLTTGYELTGAPPAPGASAPVTQVMGLVLSAGDRDGEIDALWDPVPNTRVYQVQTTTKVDDPTTWKDYGAPVTRSSLALMDLPSGQRIWVRVRAIGPSGKIPGAYSEPSHKMCP